MRSLIAALVSLLAVASVQAQASLPTWQREENVQKLVQLALDHIHFRRCEGAKLCDPATAEERANPPLALAEARQIIDRGVFSGMAMHCKLDWQGRNLTPMLAYWRKTQKKTERQMALIDMLHGVVVGQVLTTFLGQPCSEQMRKGAEARLDFVAR